MILSSKEMILMSKEMILLSKAGKDQQMLMNLLVRRRKAHPTRFQLKVQAQRKRKIRRKRRRKRARKLRMSLLIERMTIHLFDLTQLICSYHH